MKVINQKLIKDRCGTVSFKRGETYYRSNKVKVDESTSQYCEATVVGEEDFHVTILVDAMGEIEARCSCPKLASFDRDCQHIAAVLLLIQNQQKSGKSTEENVTEDFFTLFQEESFRSTGKLRHFENRQILQSEFLIKLIPSKTGEEMIGIEFTIDSKKVHPIRSFLKNINEGKPFYLSDSIIFNQEFHCFENETDAVIQHLVKVSRDSSKEKNSSECLLIPPSSWEQIVPLLMRTDNVKVQQDDRIFGGIREQELPLPLQFRFGQDEHGGYRLYISGLGNIAVT